MAAALTYAPDGCDKDRWPVGGTADRVKRLPNRFYWIRWYRFRLEMGSVIGSQGEPLSKTKERRNCGRRSLDPCGVIAARNGHT